MSIDEKKAKLYLDKAMAAAAGNSLLPAQIAPTFVVELPKPVRKNPGEPAHREFFSIPELAERWRCSRGTVYNRLRKAGTKVMDWSAGGEKGKKAVRAGDVYEIENRRMKKLA